MANNCKVFEGFEVGWGQVLFVLVGLLYGRGGGVGIARAESRSVDIGRLLESGVVNVFCTSDDASIEVRLAVHWRNDENERLQIILGTLRCFQNRE